MESEVWRCFESNSDTGKPKIGLAPIPSRGAGLTLSRAISLSLGIAPLQAGISPCHVDDACLYLEVLAGLRSLMSHENVGP